VFVNKEQESFYKQRHRLHIIHKQVYRQMIDDADNVVLQYITPKHLRKELINQADESKYAAHQGRDKVFQRLKSRCYLPKMDQQIAIHVLLDIQSCEVCQASKPLAKYCNPELQAIRPIKPLELVTTDIMRPINMTIESNRYIIVNLFTKWMQLYLLKTMEAEEVAQMIATIVCRHESPGKIVSDQGSNCQSVLMPRVNAPFTI
jgi:hypothetical protein